MPSQWMLIFLYHFIYSISLISKAICLSIFYMMWIDLFRLYFCAFTGAETVFEQPLQSTILAFSFLQSQVFSYTQGPGGTIKIVQIMMNDFSSFHKLYTTVHIFYVAQMLMRHPSLHPPSHECMLASIHPSTHKSTH